MSSAARIEELQKKFDENPRRYFAPLANECRKAGDLDAAIAICRAHLPQQPGHMSGHIVYGQALFEAGEVEEARTVFETALGLDPENLIALRHMGDIAARSGDLAAARQWYMRVLETDPRNDEIQALLTGLDGAPAPATVADEPGLPTMMDPALVAAAAESTPEVVTGPVAEPLVEPVFETVPDAGAALDDAELLDFEPTSFTPPSPVEAQPERPEGIETASFEPGTAPHVTPEFALEGLETTSFEPPLDLDATGFGATGLEPTSLAMPDDVAEPAARGDAFVTETMAELYLQQGYRDRALDVYRQLITQHPDDPGLRERMARVEAESQSAAAEDFATEEIDGGESAGGETWAADPVIPGLPSMLDPALVDAAADAIVDVPASRGGPSIREYLTALATGQALPPMEPGQAGSLAASVAVAPAPGGEIAEVVDVGAELPAEGLDGVFGAAQSTNDLRAADTLAEAFAAEPVPPAPAATAEETNPLSGRPARPAGSDLSLDSVFGQPRPSSASRPTGSFSFDQFFSEDAVRAPREDAPEPTGDASADEDIEQFNDWLKGLKNQ